MGEQLKQQTLYDAIESSPENLFWVDVYQSGPTDGTGVYSSRRITKEQLLEEILSGITTANIYTQNGTVLANRTVNLQDKNLLFNGTGQTVHFNQNDLSLNKASLLKQTLDSHFLQVTNGVNLSTLEQTESTFELIAQDLLGYTILTQNSGYSVFEFFTPLSTLLFKVEMSKDGMRINDEYYLPKIKGLAGQILVDVAGTGDLTWEYPTVPNSYSTGSLYYLNESKNQDGYKEFSTTKTTSAEQEVSLTLSGGSTGIIESFFTSSLEPNTFVIPEGLWSAYLHMYGSNANDDWTVWFEVSKVDVLNNITPLFTSDPNVITNIGITTSMFQTDGIFSETPLINTDRLLVEIKATNNNGSSATINLVTESSQHYSIINTSLLNADLSNFYVSNTTVDAGNSKSVPMRRLGSFGVVDDVLNPLNETVIFDGSASLRASSDSNLALASFSDSEYTNLRLIRRRGDLITQTNALNGDILGAINFARGSNDGSFVEGGVVLRAIATQDQNSQTEAGASFLIATRTVDLDALTPAQVRFEITELGEIKFNGEYTFPMNHGIFGQVLVDDGAGNLTWQDFPTSANIYNSDGAINSNRTVYLAEHNFKVEGGGIGPQQIIHMMNNNAGSTSANVIQLDNLISYVRTPYVKSEKYQYSNECWSLVENSVSGYNTTISQKNTIVEFIVNTDLGVVPFRMAIDANGLLINNQYTLPKVKGLSGQVLTDNGSGTVSWQTPSAPTSTNIYNTDGTLSANRIFTLGTNNLRFNGSGNTIRFYQTNGALSSLIEETLTQLLFSISNASGGSIIQQTQSAIVHQISDSLGALLFKISVNANGLTINNVYTLPKVDGSSGSSLITDGAGNVTWGAPSTSTSMQTIGRNSTGATLYKGTVVYISGSTGNRPNFLKARANAESTSAGTFGIVVSDIANNSDGYVVTIGAISNLDTRSTATNPFTTDTLVDGDTIYLSPTNAGYVTNIKPSAPNHLVYIGKVVQTSPTNGTIVYRIQNGYELDEIHDVAISSVANNDFLQYESASSLWKNKAITTANISENTNLYFTNARAIASVLNSFVSGAGTVVSTDTILQAIQKIVGNQSLKQNIITLTTTGTSGNATFDGTTLNIPVYSGGGSSNDIWKALPTESFRGTIFTNNSVSVASPLTLGLAVPTSSGTLVAKTVANTNFASKVIGIGVTASLVVTGRYTGLRGGALLWYLGGGFRFVASFNISDTVYGAGCRQFYGMQGSIVDLTFTDTILVDSLINCIGVGSDVLDTNLQMFYNDGTGLCTKIDLGASFPANRTAGAISTTVYDVQILNMPNQATVDYRVTNNETGAVATGTISTNLPLSTQGLNYFSARTMGAPLTNTGQYDLKGKFGVYSI